MIAGRLAGAFRNIGRADSAEEILQIMKAAGYNVREKDPFGAASPLLFSSRAPSPYVNRLRLMWQSMRQPVLDHFPGAPGIGCTQSTAEYLKQVEEIYTTDAYHSLSIEGYKVTPELIERVRQGSWSPDSNATDREQVSALAARGYWQAFQPVKGSIEKILGGANAGDVVSADHRDWYREMFAPGVTAGMLPSFVSITDGKTHDMTLARTLDLPADSIVVMDRAYIDYVWFNALNDKGIFFVTRQKRNATYHVIERREVLKNKGVTSDHGILISGTKAKDYPIPLR